MNRALIVRIAAVVVLGAVAAGSWVETRELNLSWAKYGSAAVFFITLGLTVWDVYLWRLPWIQLIPQVPRSVHGTWLGTLTQVLPDSGNNNVSGAGKKVVIEIRQTSTRISVRLLSDESTSSSLSATLISDGQQHQLSYVYHNRPNIEVEHASRMHNGAAILSLLGSPAGRLKGRYWTDRDTKGSLEFSRRHRTFAGGFEEAVQLFEPTVEKKR